MSLRSVSFPSHFIFLFHIHSHAEAVMFFVIAFLCVTQLQYEQTMTSHKNIKYTFSTIKY